MDIPVPSRNGTIRGFCLLLLNSIVIVVGSLPLLLWMAPPNPMTYLLAPIALAILLAELAPVVVIGITLFVAILSFWSAQKPFWWLVTLSLLIASLLHSIVAVQVFHGLAG